MNKAEITALVGQGAQARLNTDHCRRGAAKERRQKKACPASGGVSPPLTRREYPVMYKTLSDGCRCTVSSGEFTTAHFSRETA